MTAIFSLAGRDAGDANFLSFLYLLFSLNHQIAWRFICAGIIVSPVFLFIISVRGRFSPGLRSWLLGTCLIGLLLPYHRSIFFLCKRLHLATYRAGKILQIPNLRPFGGADTLDVFEMLSGIWLIGFLIFSAVRFFDYRKTIHKFRRGEIQSCASYFYRFSSRIYLPPDFKTAYTEEEQKMLLTHEKQHIAQHDPFIYRLLMILECFFWFNPLVLKVIRLFQHERELLCDERVTRRYPKYAYGLLILKAAQRSPAVRATAGMVSEGSIKERVTAMIAPIVTIGKKTTIAVVFLASMLFVTGFIGFRSAYFAFKDISPELMKEFGLTELHISTADSFDAFRGNGRNRPHLESMEQFITPSKNGMKIDAPGMYEYALSLGFDEKQWIRIDHLHAVRPDWGGGAISSRDFSSPVADLNTAEPIIISYKGEHSFFQMLTDILL